MAASTFTAAGSGAVFSPAVGEPWSSFVHGGHTTLRPAIVSSQIDFRFTGSRVEMQFAVQSNLDCFFYVWVDGAAVMPTPVPASLDTFQWVTLADGLADGEHAVSVKFNTNNGVNTWVEAGVSGAFRVTGSAPAMAAPAGFGPQTRLIDPAVEGHLLFEGIGWTKRVGAGDYINQRADSIVGYDAALSFYGRFSSLWVWATLQGGKWRLMVDRDTPDPVTYSVTAPNIGSTCTGWVRVAEGLDDANDHLYTLVNTQPSQGFSHRYLMTSRGTGINLAATPAIQKWMVIYGDSIAGGVSATLDSSLALGSRLARRKGWALENLGIGACTVREFPGDANIRHTTASCEKRTAEITSLSPLPEFVILQGGTNEMDQTFGSPPILQTPLGLQEAVDRELTAILAARPELATRMVYLGIVPRSGFSQARIDEYNAALLAGIEGRIPFLDPREWDLAGAAYRNGGAFDFTYLPDGLHPNELGYGLILEVVWAFLEVEYGVTGPVDGALGESSEPFTLTLAGGSQFFAGQSVTLTAAEGAITVTAPGAEIVGNGTGMVSVTPGVVSGFSFTYLPEAAGAQSLQFSNSQGWPDPAPLTYMAYEGVPMAARASLAVILLRLRRLIDDRSESPEFSDVELQDALDRYRTDYSALALAGVASYPSGLLTYLTFSAPVGDWEEGVVFQDGSYAAVVPVESNLLNGQWRFGVEPDGQTIYATGKAHNLFAAAAELCETWAGVLDRKFDVTDGGESLKRSQMAAGKRQLAAQFQERAGVAALGAAVSAALSRCDVEVDRTTEYERMLRR